MIILDKRKYERIVSEIIDAKDVRELAERYSLDRVYYYHILKDITLGERSPNYNLLKSIAKRRKLGEDFVIEQAKLILNFFMPYHQGLQTDSLDYYKVLNVPRNATDEEIRRSWIELMKAHHPDKAGAEGLDTSKRINEAYEVLSSSSKREAYDNRHLPPTAVIVPQTEMKKYYYAGALAVVVFLAVMYASGSGLIFQSPEEKERLVREFEAPHMPNTVYKGDYLDSDEVDKQIAEIKPIEETRGDRERAAPEQDKHSGQAGDKVSEAPEKPSSGEKTEVADSGLSESPAPPDEAEAPGAESIGDNAAAEKIEVAAPEPAAEKKAEITEVTPDSPENEAPPAAPAPAEQKTRDEETLVAKSEAVPSAPVENKKEMSTDDIPALEPAAKSAGAVTEDDTPAGGKGEAVKDEEKPVEEVKLAEAEKEKTPGNEPSGKPDKTLTAKGEITEIAVPRTEKLPGGREYYTVRSGDSLWTIARKFGTTTGELEALNGLADTKLNIGDRILISGAPAARLMPPAVSSKKEEPAPAVPLIEEKPSETVVSGAVTTAKPPVKTDITEGFDPSLASSAVAVREAAVRAPEPIAPVLPPDRDSVYGFVSDYVSAYKNRDIDRVKALFAPDAIENGVSISRVINNYSSNFSNFDIMKYDVKVSRVSVENTLGYVRGEFYITFKDQRTGTLKNSRGTINWTLSWTEGAWKIRELTYKIENTDTMG